MIEAGFRRNSFKERFDAGGLGVIAFWTVMGAVIGFLINFGNEGRFRLEPAAWGALIGGGIASLGVATTDPRS